jgi:hypothetical protein
MGGALLAASMVLLVPALMGLAYGLPYRFSLGDYYLKVALSSLTLGYLRNLMISGLVMLVASVGLLGLGIRKLTSLIQETV